MYSKYERRTDTRTYEDRRKLYEGVSYRVQSDTGRFIIPNQIQCTHTVDSGRNYEASVRLGRP